MYADSKHTSTATNDRPGPDVPLDVTPTDTEPGTALEVLELANGEMIWSALLITRSALN